MKIENLGQANDAIAALTSVHQPTDEQIKAATLGALFIVGNIADSLHRIAKAVESLDRNH